MSHARLWLTWTVADESHFVNIDTQPCDSIDTIKKGILTEAGIPKARQQLRLQTDGPVLADEKPIHETTKLYLEIIKLRDGNRILLESKRTHLRRMNTDSPPPFPKDLEGNFYRKIESKDYSRILNGEVGPEAKGHYFSQVSSGENSCIINGNWPGTAKDNIEMWKVFISGQHSEVPLDKTTWP